MISFGYVCFFILGTLDGNVAAVGHVIEEIQQKMPGELASVVNFIPLFIRGYSTLFSAAFTGHCEIARMLIACGADANLRAYVSTHSDSFHGHLQFACLRDEDTGALAKQWDGATPLHYSARWGNLPLVQLLLQCNASAVSACNYDQSTPLHFAARAGHVDVAECLLSHAPDINAQDAGGNTALHHAATAGHVLMVRVLILRGASLDCVNVNGHRPLHIARPKCASILLKVCGLLLCNFSSKF